MSRSTILFFFYYHTKRGTIELRGTMKSAEETLFPHHFAKCNHWYIVNLAHVKRITKDTVIVGGQGTRDEPQSESRISGRADGIYGRRVWLTQFA